MSTTKNRLIQVQETAKAVGQVHNLADPNQGDLIAAAYTLLEAGVDHAYSKNGGDGIIEEVAKMSTMFAYILEINRREAVGRGKPDHNNARTVLANVVIAAIVALSTIEDEPNDIMAKIEGLRGDLRFESQVDNLRELAVLLADGHGGGNVFSDVLADIRNLPEF